MSKTIISKRCSKCKQIKPLSEFSKRKDSKDNHRNHCESCYYKYMAEYQKKYRQTEKGKISKKRYTQSKKHKIAQKRYRQNEKGKIVYKKGCQKYAAKYPERRKAKNAVNNAIIAGKLPPTKILKCFCRKQAEQYHHPSYEPECQLDVIPVCRLCHRKIHSLCYSKER